MTVGTTLATYTCEYNLSDALYIACLLCQFEHIILSILYQAALGRITSLRNPFVAGKSLLTTYLCAFIAKASSNEYLQRPHNCYLRQCAELWSFTFTTSDILPIAYYLSQYCLLRFPFM